MAQKDRKEAGRKFKNYKMTKKTIKRENNNNHKEIENDKDKNKEKDRLAKIKKK